MEEKIDAMLKLMTAMHSDSIETKKKISVMIGKISGIETEIFEIKVQTNKNTKKIDQIVKHAVKSDERFGRLEKQMVAIGVELKDDHQALEKRVTTLEKEVFQELTH